MPEGDTVRRLADRISARFVGQRCQRSIVRDPRITHLDLTGRRLDNVDASGKWLLLRFDDGRTVYGHLRMDGHWELGRRSRAPEWRRRLEAELEDGWLTAVDMPLIGVVATSDEHSVFGHLGPDLCRPEPPDIDLITGRLADDPHRPLAGALLDQRNVAGFGNVYAVEVPFIAGVSPHQPVGTVIGLDTLVAAGAALIRTNAERGPQNTTGRRLHTAHHWVYGRRRQPCSWCSTPLDGAGERDVPWKRVTTWCRSCQLDEPERVVDVARIERALALHPARRRWPVEHAIVQQPPTSPQATSGEPSTSPGAP
ncbi:MAG: DNA-formamidopyrimidine glycosylase family protein [Ilumatobacter sp.]